MFERYTEKARRTIFFARYEASQVGSPYIETEHLLLGLLRENRVLAVRFLKAPDPETVRQEIEARLPRREPGSTGVDLPLTEETKQVLVQAAEEADRLHHRHIGTEHLFLGLLVNENSLAATFLSERGVTLESARAMISGSGPEGMASQGHTMRERMRTQTVVLHGTSHLVEAIRKRVMRCRRCHWEKKKWTPSDVVVIRGRGTVSFDLSLAGTTPEMELVKGGWKEDECAVCSWKMFEGTAEEQATAYTNGRDWICIECCEKFWAGTNFFGEGFSAMT